MQKLGLSPLAEGCRGAGACPLRTLLNEAGLHEKCVETVLDWLATEFVFTVDDLAASASSPKEQQVLLSGFKERIHSNIMIIRFEELLVQLAKPQQPSPPTHSSTFAADASRTSSSDPPPVRTRSEQQAPQTSKRAKAQAQKKLEKRLEQAATAQPVMAPPPPLPSGPPVCNDWNQLNGKPGCSRGSTCKFLHACLLCGGAHPGKYCPRSRGQ